MDFASGNNLKLDLACGRRRVRGSLALLEMIDRDQQANEEKTTRNQKEKRPRTCIFK